MTTFYSRRSSKCWWNIWYIQRNAFFKTNHILLRMMKCLRILILCHGQRMKHFVSLASAAELADANSQNLATPISHSFHTNVIKQSTGSVQLTSSLSNLCIIVNNVCNIKSTWFILVSIRRSVVLSLPLQEGVHAQGFSYRPV
jgi:hypothetical protein